MYGVRIDNVWKHSGIYFLTSPFGNQTEDILPFDLLAPSMTSTSLWFSSSPLFIHEWKPIGFSLPYLSFLLQLSSILFPFITEFWFFPITEHNMKEKCSLGFLLSLLNTFYIPIWNIDINVNINIQYYIPDFTSFFPPNKKVCSTYREIWINFYPSKVLTN